MESNDAKASMGTRVILKGPNGEFKVDLSTHIIVQCADGKFVEVPKEQDALCPFIKDGESIDMKQCEFSATVLENLVRWTWKYGVTGSANSAMVKPCIYRDFSYVVTDSWDADFFRHHLCSAMALKHFLPTMNAAEQYGMTGLLEFMAIGLGCKLRNDDDSATVQEILGVTKDDVTPEDLEQVPQDYSWFAEATTPVVMK